MSKTTLTSFITDIADAVRGKTGKSEPIAALSLADEITAIKTSPALQQKVAEPTDKIQIISADAGYDGLSSVLVNPAKLLNKTFACGSVTLSQNTTQYTVKHSLGRVPQNIVFAVTVNTVSPDTVTTSLTRFSCENSVAGYNFTAIASNVTKMFNTTGLFADITYESTSVSGNGCFTSVTTSGFTVTPPEDAPLAGGMTYSWIVW